MTTFIWILVMIASVALDQISKIIVANTLAPDKSVELIHGFLRISYVENEGAAFGMFSDRRWIFLVISTVAIVALWVYLFVKRPQSKLICVALSLVIGGGIGNMIDRVRLAYVIDFIDFYGIWPYVFNIADSCVCVGGALIVLACILSMISDHKNAKADKGAVASSDSAANQTKEESANSADSAAVGAKKEDQHDDRSDPA